MRVKGLNCELSLRQRLIGWPSDSTFALADLDRMQLALALL